MFMMFRSHSKEIIGKLGKWLVAGSCAGALFLAGCDTPGESGAAAGLLGATAGFVPGAPAGTSLLVGAAAGLLVFAVQSSYQATPAQQQAASVRAQKAVEEMPAATTAKAKLLLVPVPPSNEHPQANQMIVVDKETKTARDSVVILPESPRPGTMVKLSTGEEVLVAS